jgi:tRNA modification GTPase
MSVRFDTIVAPITGLPPAAVAIVRVSGPDAFSVAASVFRPWPDSPKLRTALYGHFVHGDDGLAIPFAEGHSYTGEPTVELSIHGSAASVRKLLEACEQAGARPALPGEFTQRAFLHGRIDLTQAEAVRETIESETEVQLRSANRNREGALRVEVSNARFELLGLLARVEATVDFSEEIGDLDRDGAIRTVDFVTSGLKRLLSNAHAGRLVRHGLRIAIVGPPNAGKSSLLNRLLGSDRAIVSEIAGTTRDYVEERASFSGYPIVLVDTAGLRDSEDPIEVLGIQRSRAAAANADLIWFVRDARIPMDETSRAFLSSLDRPSKVLANKADLAAPTEDLAVSALTGLGIAELIEQTVAEFQEIGVAPLVNDRQAHLLHESLRTLRDAREHLEGQTPSDLLSVLLNEALATLGEITGETADPDTLQRIFRDFCIGK